MQIKLLSVSVDELTGCERTAHRAQKWAQCRLAIVELPCNLLDFREIFSSVEEVFVP